MADLNQVTQEEKQNRLLDALSYLPFLFILNLMQNGKNEKSMWHSKMGALSTLIFMIPVIVGAFISVFFGGMLYGFFFLYIGLSGYKAWSGDKLEIPFLTKIGTKIPLEMFLKKNTTIPVEPPTSSQVTSNPAPTPTATPATTLPTTPVQTNTNLKP